MSSGEALLEQLQARGPEIEAAILARACAISSPAEVRDPAYLDGLRTAVSVGLDYGIAALGGAGGSCPPVPPALLAQARLAARGGVSLDVVLRRYAAGHSLLGDLLVEEAGEGALAPRELRRLLRRLSTAFDRLLDAVSAEFLREERDRPRTSGQRRLRLVRGLLDGELVEVTGLGYEIDHHHVAIIAVGRGAQEAVRGAATRLDRRLLLVDPGEGLLWAWFGGHLPFVDDQLGGLVASLRRAAAPADRVFIALGEPARGLDGWRLSHRQAAAALPVARRDPSRFARYADVALLASALQDDLLATSLRQLYLDPLADKRDGGAILHETLRAYFASEHNVSSAAAALGVNRNTVTSRLRTVEARLGRRLGACGAELEAALRLHEALGEQVAGSPGRR